MHTSIPSLLRVEIVELKYVDPWHHAVTMCHGPSPPCHKELGPDPRALSAAFLEAVVSRTVGLGVIASLSFATGFGSGRASSHHLIIHTSSTVAFLAERLAAGPGLL